MQSFFFIIVIVGFSFLPSNSISVRRRLVNVLIKTDPQPYFHMFHHPKCQARISVLAPSFAASPAFAFVFLFTLPFCPLSFPLLLLLPLVSCHRTIRVGVQTFEFLVALPNGSAASALEVWFFFILFSTCSSHSH